MDIEKQSKVLSEISKRYPVGSVENESLKKAAQALLFVFTENLTEAFERYLRESEEELSDEQKESLRQMGLSDT